MLFHDSTGLGDLTQALALAWPDRKVLRWVSPRTSGTPLPVAQIGKPFAKLRILRGNMNAQVK
jgi:hypothetical protein